MCGLATIFNYRSQYPINIHDLQAMNDCMVNRGPDGSGIWLNDDKKIGFAHRRLSIIDLSEKGAQPMHLQDGTLSIVFNGEIYNYKQLRNQLKLDGIEFTSHTDTEVLLHLYKRMGKQMVHELQGMFAFAIYDKSCDEMFLARDPNGIKPLYYADDGSTFAAASQVKALLPLKWIDKKPRPAGHVGFFLMGSVPEPYTLFKGISALPAGSYMKVRKGKPVDVKAYANLSRVLSESNAKVSESEEESENILRNELSDTVEKHLIADVEVGLFLSAGLDSTTLTALASEFKSSIKSVTLGFEEFKGSNSDETTLANKVAERYDTKHQTEWVNRKDFATEHDNLFKAMDQPSIDGVNTYFVSKITRQAGLKVALSGIGGDELFGGYGSFQQIPKLVRYVQSIPFAEQMGAIFRKVTAPFIQQFASAKYPGIFEYGGSYEGAYLLRRGLFMPWELPDLLEPDFVKKGLQELQLLDLLQNTIQGIESKHSKISALESSWYMKNQLLRDADWAGMAHSLEIRVPLVDWHLLNRITPYVNAWKLNKQSMARTPKKKLPPEILNRKKTGFQIPVEDWLMDAGNGNGNHRNSRKWAKVLYSNYLESCGMKPELLNC
jgi:asparagine synthase (glutamine-hydrolysing)